MSKTCFLWDPVEDNIVKELNGVGIAIADYATEPHLYGNVISQNRSGIESQFHYDAVGSTLAVTGSNQQLNDTRGYSAFGETISQTGLTRFPYNYVGQKGYYKAAADDEYSVRHREYMATESRWTSADPIVLEPRILHEALLFGTWPPTHINYKHISHHKHTYAYAENAPLLAIDPSGTTPITGPWNLEIFARGFEDLMRDDTDPSPHALRGFPAAVADVPPECDPGCKAQELKREVSGPSKEIARRVKMIVERCAVYDPGVRGAGKPVGEHHTIFKRTAQFKLVQYFSKLQWRLVCVNDPTEPCGPSAESQGRCKDKLSEAFGPLVWGEVTQKPFTDWVIETAKIGGPPPEWIPKCMMEAKR